MSDIVYIRRNLKAMSFLGLWDYWQFNDSPKRILFKIYSKVLLSIFFLFHISQLIEMFKIMLDVSLLMTNLGLTILYLVTIFKIFPLHFRRGDITKLLGHIQGMELKVKDEEQQSIYEDYTEHCWVITRLFWFTVGSTLVFFFVERPVEFSILGPQEINGCKTPLIFSSWFPYDKFADWYYTLSYVIQVVCSSIGASFISLSDTFVFACMIFPVGQLKILQDKIKKDHVDIFDYLTDLDEVIRLNVLVNFSTCSLLICAVGLEGIISGWTIRFGLNTYYVLALVIQLFLYYWHANEISEESVNVGLAVSQCDWYEESDRIKKALLLIMTRAQKPYTLSVGGFFPMSLNTFLMLLKTTYSFLALFREVYKKQKNA